MTVGKDNHMSTTGTTPTNNPRKERDRELIRNIQAGDAEGLDELMNVHAPAIRNYFTLRHRPPQYVDDLIQETFLRVLRFAGQYQGRTSVKSWIFDIAINKDRDMWRQSHNTKRNDGETHSLDNLYVDIIKATHDHCTPSTELEEKEDARVQESRLDIVRRAIARLPEDARETYALHAAGLTRREIAAQTGHPVGTVKSRISRATQILKKEVRDPANLDSRER
jgi:RNA polymerase sigma-70 factor (ECF subfamily)